MKLSTQSSVPVYTISGSSTARPLPEWLARRRKRSLKSDPEFASRVELLQDFEFEEASQCIRVSEDGQWVMSTGNSHIFSLFSSLGRSRIIAKLNRDRHLQATNSYALFTPSIIIFRPPHHIIKYYIPTSIFRLFEISPSTSGSVTRVSHSARMSSHNETP
jgi:hypothetical protein